MSIARKTPRRTSEPPPPSGRRATMRPAADEAPSTSSLRELLTSVASELEALTQDYEVMLIALGTLSDGSALEPTLMRLNERLVVTLENVDAAVRESRAA